MGLGRDSGAGVLACARLDQALGELDHEPFSGAHSSLRSGIAQGVAM